MLIHIKFNLITWKII